MSWGFTIIGKKSDVLAALKDPGKCKAYGDASQMESAMKYIVAEVEAMPEGPGYFGTKGVKVEASGHHDGISRNSTIKVEQAEIAGT